MKKRERAEGKVRGDAAKVAEDAFSHSCAHGRTHGSTCARATHQHESEGVKDGETFQKKRAKRAKHTRAVLIDSEPLT